MPKKKRGDPQRTDGGAWGFKIMQSDHDYDIIKDVTGELGLFNIEGDDQCEAVATGDPRGNHKHSFCGDAGSIEEDAEKCVSYLMYSNLCSNIPKVRAHLNRGGLLRDLLHDLWRDYNANIEENERDVIPSKGDTTYSYSKVGYKFVLVTACGMSLGCQLRDFKQKMREVYKDVGLMRDALKQIEAATCPDSGYRDGEPWNFGSKGLKDTILSRDIAVPEDRLCEDSVNVRPPGINHRLNNYVVGDMARDMLASHKSNVNEDSSAWNSPTELGDGYQSTLMHNWGDDDKCGACGATEAKTQNKKLLACAQCKLQKYCSKPCQKLHWPVHKQKCLTLTQQVGQAGLKFGHPDIRPIQGELEEMTEKRRKVAFFKNVDPELMRRFCNEKLHEMMTELINKNNHTNLPADWEETLQDWYHQSSPTWSLTEKQLVVLKTLFLGGDGRASYTADHLELHMMLTLWVLQGKIEGKDPVGVDPIITFKLAKLPKDETEEKYKNALGKFRITMFISALSVLFGYQELKGFEAWAKKTKQEMDAPPTDWFAKLDVQGVLEDGGSSLASGMQL